LLFSAALCVNADFTGWSLRTNVSNALGTYLIGDVGDINGDGFPEIVVDGGDASVYIIYGSSTVLDVDDIDFVASAQVRITSNSSAPNFGNWQISPLGDIDNDGFNDFFVNGYAGVSYLFYGGSNLPALIETDTMTTEGTIVQWGTDPSGYPNFATSIDINKDGFIDLAMGSQNELAAVVVYGTGARFPLHLNISTVTLSEGFFFYGPANSGTGHWVANVKDTNGDGYDDLLIGMHYYQDLGAAYLIYGRTSFSDIIFGSRSPSDGVLFYNKDHYNYDDFGHAVASAGDFNNDGLADILMTNPHISYPYPPDNSSTIVLYYGSRNIPPTVDVYDLPSGAGIVLLGYGYDEFGEVWSQAVGDINNDGYSDVVMGAYERGTGHVFILWGEPSHPDVIDTTAQSPYLFDFYPSTSTYEFGWSLALQDYNKDGLLDLFVINYYDSFIYHNIGISPSSTPSLSPAASASGSEVRIPEYYETSVSILIWNLGLCVTDVELSDQLPMPYMKLCKLCLVIVSPMLSSISPLL